MSKRISDAPVVRKRVRKLKIIQTQVEAARAGRLQGRRNGTWLGRVPRIPLEIKTLVPQNLLCEGGGDAILHVGQNDGEITEASSIK